MVALGDVAGKGSPAALLMALLLAMLRTLASDNLTPDVLAEKLNRLVHQQTPGTRFITMFLAILDPTSGQLVYCNAGQTPPLLVNSGETTLLTTGGMALGMFEAATYAVETCTLAKDDLLLLYSDGITEAEDPEGRPLDEDGLRQQVQQNLSTPVDQIGPNLIRAVGQYAQTSKFADDLTVMALRRL